MDITRKDSMWLYYVEQAVELINDSNIYTHFVPYKETGGNPSIEEQDIMAKSFTRFINENKLIE